ncbi:MULTISPECIES: hypothetical protein [Niastella]|uniref:Uncharacterized protein n=1 Tax=Niastella soli TaxID=2821487 RepID=A0ABS3YUP3_9BACT|nr:hypothetical protein [Niastella soli]MBO9201549.1 hypothetical protein [Niastella soli]
MNYHRAFKPDLRLLIGSLVATISIYILTALHHAYGAWLYKTPWRLHILYHGLLLLLITGAFLLLYEWRKKKVFLYLYLAAAGLFFGGFIGVYEGIYNHLLKNILFFTGLSTANMHWLFPPSLYEMPNDWLFEITGVLQALFGLVQLHYLVKIFREINLSSNHNRIKTQEQ